MEPKFKTSFIPKRPIAGPVPGSAVARAAGVNFLMLLATVVFIASALFAAGLFLYKLTLEQSIQGQLASLERVRQSFEENFIGQATRLNKRIVASTRLLERHLSPSEIFTLLEQATLQTVALKTLTFSDNIEGKIIVRGSGEGDSFRSIVLQSDQFGQSGFMRDVLFSGLAPNERGNVDFTFEAVLDPQLISYKRSIGQVVPTQQAETQDEPPAVEQLDDEDFGAFGPGADQTEESQQ